MRGAPLESDSSLRRARSRHLRRTQTDAEGKLWAQLRSRQVQGAKFRRQHAIGPYIVDFCCPERQLVVEVDGGQHALHGHADGVRTEFLAQQGYRVLRYWNNEVITNMEGVLERISEVLENPHPSPLPERERG